MGSPPVQWKPPQHCATSKGKWFDPSTSSPVLCSYSSSGAEVILGYCCQNHRGGASSSFTRGADKVWLCVGLPLRNVLLCGASERSPRALASVPDGEIMLQLWSLLGHWQRLALSLSSLWPHIFLRLWEFYIVECSICHWSWSERVLGLKSYWGGTSRLHDCKFVSSGKKLINSHNQKEYFYTQKSPVHNENTNTRKSQAEKEPF